MDSNFKKFIKILAVIPARGGSKGLPGKNIKPLAGKPMLAYSIEEAQKSKYIQKIIVSSDDSNIIEVAKNFGAETIARPFELAKDDTPTTPVLLHAIKYLHDTEGYNPDLVLVLQPTSPLRTVRHIDETVEKFLKGDFDSMISVKFDYKPRFEFDENGLLMQAEKRVPRQLRKPTVIENGALYLINADLIKDNEIIGKKIGYYEMDYLSSIDIDTITDFTLAEQIILNRDKFN